MSSFIAGRGPDAHLADVTSAGRIEAALRKISDGEQIIGAEFAGWVGRVVAIHEESSKLAELTAGPEGLRNEARVIAEFLGQHVPSLQSIAERFT